jgi:hypothetical protein
MAQEQLDLSVGALRAVRLSTREPNQVGERGLRLLIELARFRRRTQRSESELDNALSAFIAQLDPNPRQL